MNKMIKLNGKPITFDLNSVATPYMDYPEKHDEPLKSFFKADRYLSNAVDYTTLKMIRIPFMASKDKWQVIIIAFDLSRIFHPTKKDRKPFQDLVPSTDINGNKVFKTLPGPCNTWATEYIHHKNGDVEHRNIWRPREIDDADKASEPENITAIICSDIDKTTREGEIIFDDCKVKAAIHLEPLLVEEAHKIAAFKHNSVKILGENNLDKKTTATKTENIFRKSGNVWEICFKGGRIVSLQRRKGFEYLRVLLANPGKEFSLSEIKAKIDPPPPSEHNIHDIDKIQNKDGKLEPIISTRTHLYLEDSKLTPKVIAEVKKRLEEKKTERKDPDTSMTRREELDIEIKQCQDYLKQDIDKAGRSRKFVNDAERYRVAVAKNIENAIKNLPVELKDFARHINDCVTKGRTLKYSPASTINWLTEDM